MPRLPPEIKDECLGLTAFSSKGAPQCWVASWAVEGRVPTQQCEGHRELLALRAAWAEQGSEAGRTVVSAAWAPCHVTPEVSEVEQSTWGMDGSLRVQSKDTLCTA